MFYLLILDVLFSLGLAILVLVMDASAYQDVLVNVMLSSLWKALDVTTKIQVPKFTIKIFKDIVLVQNEWAQSPQKRTEIL